MRFEEGFKRGCGGKDLLRKQAIEERWMTINVSITGSIMG
jgi:hypothetical protein